ncbi:TetR/AcrR family transcriptional regulator [Parafrankia sp. EUN1f]|uniref:TetR/AcrR family transcriptional regulator n=1 Tax=Parafrankia sp. EUN1f TaxID=102897 RepID=UPI0001C43DED|nr:TetR/AcrR family transcriptional regulator [Parafrankia sp. EUN1f]EFC85755.1 transcriptional regulator, TetR family [Parafrankia sp. EUN1f]
MTSDTDTSYRARRDGQREDSRNRILDAAVDCLVEGGYVNATTPRIQKRAGISRGGLLHHFPSRDALLVAASEHLARRRIAISVARAEQIARSHPVGPERLTQMVELLWSTFHEPHWWAALELWTAARTNDEIATALRPTERHLGGIVRGAVDAMFGPYYVGHPRYPQVRELLLSSMRGLALAYTFDRRDPTRDPNLSMWKDLVLVLLDGQDQ